MNSKNSTANVVRTRARSAKSRKLAGRVGTKRRGRSIRKTSHKVARKRSARKLKRRSIRKNRFGGIELIQRKSSTSSNPFPTPAVGDGSMRRLSTSSRDSAFPTRRSSASTGSTASAFADSQTSEKGLRNSINSINSQSSGQRSSVGSRGSVESESAQVVPEESDDYQNDLRSGGSNTPTASSSIPAAAPPATALPATAPPNSVSDIVQRRQLEERMDTVQRKAQDLYNSNVLDVKPLYDQARRALNEGDYKLARIRMEQIENWKPPAKKVSFWDRWDRLKRPFSKIGTTTPATPEPPKKKISWNPFAAKEKEPIKNNLSPEQMKQLRNKRIDLTGPVTEPEIVEFTRTPGGPVTYQNFPVSDKKTPDYYKYIKEPIDNGQTSTGQNYTIAPRMRVLGPGPEIVDLGEVPTRPTGFDKFNQIPKKYKSIDGIIAKVSKICDEIKKAKAAAKEIKD